MQNFYKIDKITMYISWLFLNSVVLFLLKKQFSKEQLAQLHSWVALSGVVVKAEDTLHRDSGDRLSRVARKEDLKIGILRVESFVRIIYF